MPEMHDYYEKETTDFWIQKAPKIDQLITVTKARGAKIQVNIARNTFKTRYLLEL